MISSELAPSPFKERFLRLTRNNLFIVFTGNGLSTGLRIATFGLLARWLSRGDFGQWVLFQTYFTLFDSVRTGFQTAFVNQAAGCDDATFRRWTGAAWQLATGVTLLAIVLLWVGAFVAKAVGYSLDIVNLAGWFTALALVTIPNCLSGWTLFARSRFRQMQFIGMSIQCIFLGLIVVQWFIGTLSPVFLYGSYVLASGVAALVISALGWSGWRYALIRATDERLLLWRFGKYSVSTLFVANFLRASDTMLLGAFLGPVAVVMYHVPQRIVELLEMIVRSTIMASTPRLAGLYDQGKTAMATWFQQTAGRLWIMMLPLSISCAVFAEPLVVLVGGGEYRNSSILLRIFMIYISLSPLDRFSGIGLEAVRKPRLNLQKVLLMLVANILGDLIALVYFKSVEGVALASIGTFVTGLLVGFSWLSKSIPVSLAGTVRAGIQEIRQDLHQLTHARVR